MAITSLTNALAFALGAAMTTIPFVRAFCTVTGAMEIMSVRLNTSIPIAALAVGFDLLLELFFFAPMLVLFGRRTAKTQRRFTDLTPKVGALLNNELSIISEWHSKEYGLGQLHCAEPHIVESPTSEKLLESSSDSQSTSEDTPSTKSVSTRSTEIEHDRCSELCIVRGTYVFLEGDSPHVSLVICWRICQGTLAIPSQKSHMSEMSARLYSCRKLFFTECAQCQRPGRCDYQISGAVKR